MEWRNLTVVDITDWSILFDGDKLIDQDHDITTSKLADVTNGQPFTLRHVSAYDTEFDATACKNGAVAADTILSDVLGAIGKRR